MTDLIFDTANSLISAGADGVGLQHNEITRILATADGADIISTGSFTVPVGTTGEEPTPANGMLRYDSTTNTFRGVVSGAWADLGGSDTFDQLTATNSNFIDLVDSDVAIRAGAVDPTASPHLELGIGPGGAARPSIQAKGNSTSHAVFDIQRLGGDVHLGSQVASGGNGTVRIYHSNGAFADFVLETGPGGIIIEGTSGSNTILDWRAVGGSIAVRGQYDGFNFKFDSLVNSAEFQWQSRNSGAAIRQLLHLDPDAGAQIYHAASNAIVLETNTQGISVSNTVAEIISGTLTPEGAITAPIGSTFTRTDGGAATTLYVKESGAGNTGWVAVGGASLALDDLTDVNVPTPATNAVLYFNGANWVDAPLNALTILDGTTLQSTKFRATSSTTPSLSSTAHGLQAGATTANNIAIGSDGIMARNNGGTNTLRIQNYTNAAVSIGDITQTRIDLSLASIVLTVTGETVLQATGSDLRMFWNNTQKAATASLGLNIVNGSSAVRLDALTTGAGVTAELTARNGAGGGSLNVVATSAIVRLSQTAIGGGLEDTWIECTRNSDVALFNDNTEVARTLAAATGGWEANNTLTGAGFERVLTDNLKDNPFKFVLAAQATKLDTTLADLTGMTVALLSGVRYRFKFTAWVQSPVPGGTPGIRLRADYSAGLSSTKGRIRSWRDSGLVDSVRAVPDTTITGLTAGGGSDEALFIYEGFIETTAAGTFKMQFAQANADGSNVVAVDEGSSFEVWAE